MDALLATTIDHALLHPTLRRAELEAGCRLADEFQVASVCVPPRFVPEAARCLARSKVAVGTVIGFPHGQHACEVLAAEARVATGAGARELDLVMPIGAALEGDWDTVSKHITAVTREARVAGILVKVILETGLLPDDEVKARACEVAVAAGADYVKTSTGFACTPDAEGRLSSRGATLDDVRLMREVVGPGVGVKASGGVRTRRDAEAFLEAGATRLGTSSTTAILTEG